jgi:hypothetical protein
MNCEIEVAVVQLNPHLTAGEIAGYITDAPFDIPTTVAEFGSTLYAVNARFATPPTPTTTYDVVSFPKR